MTVTTPALSKRMASLLRDLAVLKVDIFLIRRNLRTYRALARRGLVRHAPWAALKAHGDAQSYWQITDTGMDAAHQLELARRK